MTPQNGIHTELGQGRPGTTKFGSDILEWSSMHTNTRTERTKTRWEKGLELTYEQQIKQFFFFFLGKAGEEGQGGEGQQKQGSGSVGPKYDLKTLRNRKQTS